MPVLMGAIPIRATRAVSLMDRMIAFEAIDEGSTPSRLTMWGIHIMSYYACLARRSSELDSLIFHQLRVLCRTVRQMPLKHPLVGSTPTGPSIILNKL